MPERAFWAKKAVKVKCVGIQVWKSSYKENLETKVCKVCNHPQLCWGPSGPSINIHSAFLRASPVAQRVMKLPAMREARAWSLGQEDPLEKGMATHSSILAWRIPWTEEPGGYCPWGHKELDVTEQLSLAFPRTKTWENRTVIVCVIEA